MNENGGNDLLDADGAADENGFEVAVIGMAGRFPGAANVNQFWENLCNGVESISFYTDDEVLASGVDPHLLRNPDFVPALGLLQGTEMFDAAFFRYSPREAETMAPQPRVMLECAYEALQHAGMTSGDIEGVVLVGGSPRIPLVQEAVAKYFFKVPKFEIDDLNSLESILKN